MNNIKAAFIGGGKRMFYCAESLGKKGIECALYGFDAISDRSSSTRCPGLYDCLVNSSTVILPLPVSRDGLTVNGTDIKIRLCDVFSKCPAEVPIFAGSVSAKVRAVAKEYDREIYDYYDDDILTEKNAYATAEGAVMLAMKNGDRTIKGSRCLVTGYGRIGHYTAKLLQSLGAHVTVCARRHLSRIKAELDGYISADIRELPALVNGFDIIFNTVPHNIFTEDATSEMSSSQMYIELASAPFGIDRKIADRYNVDIIDGSALPSKYCPESAGKYIAEKLICEFERSGLL